MNKKELIAIIKERYPYYKNLQKMKIAELKEIYEKNCTNFILKNERNSCYMDALFVALFHEKNKYIYNLFFNSDLKSFKNQNRVYFGYQTARELFKINFEKKIISFQIVKGGTGKTSITHSFAIRANLYGARVLCIDIDQQGNLSQAFNIDSKNLPVMIDIINNKASISESIVNISEGLDILPSRIENAVLDNFFMLNKFPLERVYFDLIHQVFNKYDLVLIDCPPALGQSVAAATLASDIVIAPVTPEQFSLSGLKI